MTQSTDSDSINKQSISKHSFFLSDFEPNFTEEQKTWRPLHLLNLYRLLISGVFVTIIFSNTEVKPFGTTYPELFQLISFSYLIASIINGITIRWRWPALWFQTHIHIIIDFCAVIMIMHTSGGIRSGVGLLLFLPIAAISILSLGRSSIFYAAIITLILFLDQSYLQLTLEITPSYTQTGLLGCILFLIAFLTNYLVKKTEDVAEIVNQREIDLANMEQLTQFIMQRMQTAIIVVDHLGMIKLINNTATNLLKLSQNIKEKSNLYNCSRALSQSFRSWKTTSNPQKQKIKLEHSATDLTIKFASLGNKTKSGTVIFIEDNAELTQQAQQLKLASLGRLTASIAHELRNPLAAIRHAGELLHESPTLDKTEQRLTEIIEKQSIRVNNIIDTVLDLSRRQKAEQETLNLYQWIEEFLNEYIQLPKERFYLKFDNKELTIQFDRQHLHQIFNNLIQNALRHTIEYQNHFRPIIITVGINIAKQTNYLQVMNYGCSIPKEDLAKIFEPFFTTEATGTGLGLHISREMAVCNSAILEYINIKEGACFQLTFADPRRKQ
jgi:two-component system sensor histidine kinase PilS (NtrC family)